MVRHVKRGGAVLAATSSILVAVGAAAQDVIYVDARAGGAENGTSWDDAWVDLQDALSLAVAGDHIWVATGTYQPGTVRNATFRLADNVEIYGGLAGVENPATFDPANRDLEANETILDGEITTTGGLERVFHVVTASGTSASAVLDGFTITGGRADGAGVMMQDVGGGLLIVDGSPTIRNCIFRSNESGTRGGAVHNDGGHPTFVSCKFFANRTTVTQGANNFGGAIYSRGAPGRPGGPLLIDCLFVGNEAGVGAGGYGGGFYDDAQSSATLVNCTLSENRADTDGGGVVGSPTVLSSILWANRDRRGTGRSSQILGSALVSYTCVQGGWAGTGNIADDPLFVDAAGDDGLPGTADDDLRLSPGSPCIDAGDNDTPVSQVDVDLEGNPRLVDDPVTPDRGSPRSAGMIVDMGAYEYQAVCDTAADCDDDAFCNGTEVCVGGACQPGDPPDCDDNVDCTVDSCDTVTDDCQHTPDDSSCDDGLFCDGVEVCHPIFGCQDGTPADCDDGVACTADSCGAVTDVCEHVPDDAACDNGSLCDGQETCDADLGCQPGTPIDCDDGIGCTVDACDASTGACSNTPDDDACDDGVFCNGVERCGLAVGCVGSNEPCAAPLTCDENTGTCIGCVVDHDCDDGLFCNGMETCDVSAECLAGSDPCSGQGCDEDNDVCTAPQQLCTVDEECDDQNPCTDDSCDGGECDHQPNATVCDDGDPCTESDVCSGGACAGTPIPNCGGPPPPPPPVDSDGDGVRDALDQCGGTPVGEAVDAVGCSCSQIDGDGDGVNDCDDECPKDEEKSAPGLCGCQAPDNDGDEDGTPDCRDLCAEDPEKTEPGDCGCGVSDDDTDEDGVPDCMDACPDSEAGATVEDDGCALDSPAGQPLPDEVNFDETDSPGENEDPNETDLPQGFTPGQPQCGACGAFGLISGTLLWLGLLGLKTRPFRLRR